MSEDVLADDRLVERGLQADDRRDHPATRVEPLGLEVGGQALEFLAGLRGRDDLLGRRLAGAIADHVDRALDPRARDLPGAAWPGSAAPPGRPAGPGGRPAPPAGR